MQINETNFENLLEEIKQLPPEQIDQVALYTQGVIAAVAAMRNNDTKQTA